jgi:ubiquinone/menaquinone biosynthesis C-methylase UbiE
MGLKQILNEQFGKPDGNLGRFVGWIMSIKNRDRAKWTIEKLNFKPTDYILEIGYGSGSSFKVVADQLTSGFIAGIDHSSIMLEQATKKNRKNLESKKAELKCGTVWDLDYQEEHFDIIFGSNVHFFWENPTKEFQKLYLFLKHGGRLIMIFQPRWTKSEEQVKQVAEKTKKQYEEAGFKNIEIGFKPMKPVTCIYINGHK